jgi:hypothetical protein
VADLDVAAYEIYRTHLLRNAAYTDWPHVCRQWELDPTRDAYSVVFAADNTGVKWQLITADIELARTLPQSGPAPEHDWLEVKPGWLVSPAVRQPRLYQPPARALDDDGAPVERRPTKPPCAGGVPS